MNNKSVGENISRSDFFNLRFSIENLLRLIVYHFLFVLWIVFAKEFFSAPFLFLFTVFLSLIHQREMSEWIHEASHFNFFIGKKTNDFLIQLLAGNLFANNIKEHRVGHNQHHRVNEFFEENDPDTRDFQINNKQDFIQSIAEDLLGITAFRMFFGRKKAVSSRKGSNVLFWVQLIFFQAILIGVLFFTDNIYVYICYYVSLMTLYPLLNRFRLYGQHLIIQTGKVSMSGVGVSRTIDAGLLDRVLFTSSLMMYHNEHHKYPNLPYRSLKFVMKKNSDPNCYMTTRFPLIRDFYRSLS